MPARSIKPLVIGTAHGSMRLGAYVTAWRRVKAVPSDSTFSRSLCGHGPATAAEILREFEYGMHDRINRHIPGFGVGRKYSPDWQRTAIQTAREVNTPRRAVHWLPADLRNRLAHRLADRS